jgi:choline dehydrogenase-like flavoprotein
LEPYYTKVDWEIGVSGRARAVRPTALASVSDAALAREVIRSAVRAWYAQSSACIRNPHRSRSCRGRSTDAPPCQHCGYCMAFGCEFGAKSSTLVAMIPLAQATGRCEIRPNSQVFRVVTNSAGRVREVLYYDADGREHSQKARAFIIAATARKRRASCSSPHRRSIRTAWPTRVALSAST